MAVRAVARRFWPEHTEAHVIAAVESLVPTPVTALEKSTYASEAAFQVIKDEDAHEWSRLRTAVEDSIVRLRHAGLTASSVITGADDPAKELVAEAVRINADAIFIGAHGIGRIERLLMGSVSTAVVTHADCSVEIVRLEA
jgi:nucleotide-binding universal stress UspA family protein